MFADQPVGVTNAAVVVLLLAPLTELVRQFLVPSLGIVGLVKHIVDGLFRRIVEQGVQLGVPGTFHDLAVQVVDNWIHANIRLTLVCYGLLVRVTIGVRRRVGVLGVIRRLRMIRVFRCLLRFVQRFVARIVFRMCQ